MIEWGELPADEELLSRAIDTAEDWTECADPAIRAVFGRALRELLELLPDVGEAER